MSNSGDNNPQAYFFDRDDSSHWYMIPVELREEWIALNKLDPDDEENWDAFDKFEDYRTGGGICHIEFTVTKKDW